MLKLRKSHFYLMNKRVITVAIFQQVTSRAGLDMTCLYQTAYSEDRLRNQAQDTLPPAKEAFAECEGSTRFHIFLLGWL